MSFGKNPYVPKAQAAELKAQEATDDATQVRAYRDAAHQWDRAAEREKPGKTRTEYEQHAARNRELADGGAGEEGEESERAEPAAEQAAVPGRRTLLN